MRAIDQPDQPFELTLASPTGALLDYEYEAANATFDTLLRYRQSETSYNRSIDDFVTDEGLLPDDLTESDLEDNTRQQRLDADIGLPGGPPPPAPMGCVSPEPPSPIPTMSNGLTATGFRRG